jgi:DNA polymerase-3 subunit delta
MVAVKHQSADAFLAAPDKRILAVLVFGPDAGLVSERGRLAAERLAAREKPPGEILRIEDSDLENDPDRFSVELMTVPMFGGRKIVRTTASRRVNAQLLKPLIESDLQGCLVVEAGNLKRDDSLRGLFEKSPTAAAIACYADEGASLDQLIDEVVRGQGLSISTDARQALRARLGADRGMSRSEIEKLALYVGSGSIEAEHVEAIVGDASELAVERVVSAACSGRTARALQELERAVTGGEHPQTVIAAVQRQLQRLHRLRAGLDGGRSFDELMRATRPPLPPQAQRDLDGQLRSWTLPRLTAALERSAYYSQRSRQTGAPDDLLAERLVLDIAARAAQPRRS